MIKRRTKSKKNRLFDVTISEVSLVDSPANQKPFFLFKRNGGADMKMKDDEVLSMFEDASDKLSAIVEKYDGQEKVDALEISKETFAAVSPVLNFCVAPLVEKSTPKDLPEDRKEAFVSFVKCFVGNSLTYEPEQVTKQWNDYNTVGNTPVIYPWMVTPVPVKKREDMTEEELAEDLKGVVELAKSGKKLSKKSVDVIKNAITTLTTLLEEIGELAKKDDPKPTPGTEEDPLQKEFDALSKEDQENVLKSLKGLSEEIDKLEKK